MALPEAFLQELKMKTDIGDVVSSYVTLKKRGSTLVGLCPFHNEKTPSFTVYPSTQSFYCFGCGAGGDVIGFIKKIENLDYIDAVKSLAQSAGLQMPDESSYDDSVAKVRRRILEINRESARFFHSYMLGTQGKKGLDYFLGRGLSMKTINHFGLGFAPDGWDGLMKHLLSLGFSESEMLQAGVIKRGSHGCYDMFRNRVMTPVIDVRGNIIAFGGRVLDDSKPKYVNTADTLVYKKTYELFGLNFAKDSESDSLILCEGYMDVIAMHQAGFKNAVAGCGTALTEEQVRLISRYANEVILAYDADEAGQKALNKAISLFSKTNIKIRIPSLRGGKDPDEIIKTYGKDAFKGMLEGASNEIEFALLNAKKSNNISTTQGKIDFVNDAVKILCEASPVEQDLYVSRIADELGIDKTSISLQLNDYVKKNKRKTQRRQFREIVENDIRNSKRMCIKTSLSTKQIKASDRIIAILLRYPDTLRFCGNLSADDFNDEFYSKVFSLIKERLENNKSVDLMNFTMDLSDAELGRLSGIIARFDKSADSSREINDCIKVIKDENAKKDMSDLSGISDDDFRNLFGKHNT